LSLNIIREIKSMTIIWAVHMEYTGDNKNADVVLVEKSDCEVEWKRNVRAHGNARVEK